MKESRNIRAVVSLRRAPFKTSFLSYIDLDNADRKPDILILLASIGLYYDERYFEEAYDSTKITMCRSSFFMD